MVGGFPLTYTLTVTNAGPDTATSVVVGETKLSAQAEADAVTKAVEKGVIGGGGTDEDVAIRILRELKQNLPQGLLAQLGSSASTG